MRSLRIVDDTGSLFPPRPVEFHADEIGLDVFGWNVENAALADVLARAAAASPNLRRIEVKVARFDFAPERASRRRSPTDGVSRARLVVGADGRGSSARKAAGIDVRTHRYAQSALTVLLAHTRPHDDFSTEFHTRQGPFTLVPLPADAKRALPLQSRLGDVATPRRERRAALDDDALAGEIERQARSMLGAMRIEGARGVFPMVRQIVARLVARASRWWATPRTPFRRSARRASISACATSRASSRRRARRRRAATTSAAPRRWSAIRARAAPTSRCAPARSTA